MNRDTAKNTHPTFKPKEGVFTTRQLSEILYSLEGKKEIPRKYGYFDKGVNYWANKSISGILTTQMAQNQMGFNMFVTQYKLIEQTIDIVLSAVANYSTINVIDVGCGNGWPIYPVLSYLKDKKQLGKYIAVDIVKEMTDLAVENIQSNGEFKLLDYDKVVHDFEDGHFADKILPERQNDTVNLFCFFSNTLGTMVDRHRALANLRDTMTGGDLLWIGNTLYSNAKELKEFYQKLEINGKEYLHYHSDALAFFESFEMDWTQFGHVQITDADHKGLLNYNYIVDKGFNLKFSIDEQSIILEYNNGDVIRFNKLKNYNESDLINELKDAGFKIKMMTNSDDYRAALVLVSVV